MRKLQYVLLAITAAAVIGTSGCSALSNLTGDPTTKTTAGSEEGETDPEEGEDPEEETTAPKKEKKMTVDDVVEKVSDAMDDVEDIQMDMSMSLDFVASGESAGTTLNMPMKLDMDMEVTQIGDVMHSKGEMTIDLGIANTTQEIESYGLIDGDEVTTYTYLPEAGQWSESVEDYDSGASGSFKDLMDSLKTVDQLDEDDDAYYLSGTVDISDMPLSEEYMESFEDALGFVEDVAIEYTISKDDFMIENVECSFNSDGSAIEGDGAEVTINNIEISYAFHWPAKGDKKIPSSVLDNIYRGAYPEEIEPWEAPDETEPAENPTYESPDEPDPMIHSGSGHYDGRYAKEGSTAGQKKAMEKALQHLKYGYYSKGYLKDMLELDQEIEGFSDDDIDWAVENCGADWYQQALEYTNETAENLGDSKSEFESFLVYQEFSEAEAAYAIENCSVSWKKAACTALSDLIEYGDNYTERELREHMEEDGFTDDEIAYAFEKVY